MHVIWGRSSSRSVLDAISSIHRVHPVHLSSSSTLRIRSRCSLRSPCLVFRFKFTSDRKPLPSGTMHSARSIRVKQLVPGVRTVATAPKFTSVCAILPLAANALNPLYQAQALGKWSLPKSSLSDTPAPTGSPAASPLGRWARPPQAYPGPPSHSKSSAWSGKPSHAKTTPSLQSRSTARANTTAPSLSKWARPSPDQPSTSQRPGIAETRQSTTARFQREAAPHNGRPPLPDHRPLSGRSQSNNLAVTRDDDGSGVRSSKESGPSVGAEKESSFSPIDELVETIANEKEYTRNAKYARKTFKERGSIASRIAEGVTIPRHSRVKVTQVQKSKERERKVKRNVRKVNLDVFIPSVVSVGNLARLLDIRIGSSDYHSRDAPLTVLAQSDSKERWFR